MSIRVLPIALISAMAVGLASCSGSSDQPTAQPPPPKASASVGATPGASSGTSPGTASSPTADPSQNGAADAGVDPQQQGKPVATTTVPVGYKEDHKAKAKIDILSLKRSGKLLVLTAAVTPQLSDDSLQPTLFALMGNHSFDPSLVDSVNLKQYSVVGGAGPMHSSDIAVRAGSGSSMFVYAVFAAPPADVAKLDVNFYDGVPTFVGVPIR